MTNAVVSIFLGSSLFESLLLHLLSLLEINCVRKSKYLYTEVAVSGLTNFKVFGDPCNLKVKK